MPSFILRGTVGESAANTFTEETFQVPVDPSQGIGMRILWIATRANMAVPTEVSGDPAFGRIQMALSTVQGESGMPNMGSAGLFYRRQYEWLQISDNTNPTGIANGEANMPAMVMYSADQAIQLATSRISAYVLGEGQSAATRFGFMIGYQMVRMSGQELIQALAMAQAF